MIVIANIYVDYYCVFNVKLLFFSFFFIFLIDMLDIMLKESAAEGDEQRSKTKGNGRNTGQRSRYDH